MSYFMTILLISVQQESGCAAAPAAQKTAFDFAIAVARRAKSAGVIIFLFDRKLAVSYQMKKMKEGKIAKRFLIVNITGE